jgi:PAS domain S-box-containing protein
VELAQKEREIDGEIREYFQLARDKRDFRNFYLELLVAISLFLLFVATWIGLFFSRQLSGPMTALLEAAKEVRGGNLGARVDVKAIDELAVLVRTFNEMTQALEANSKELERRRRFTEAILENIPTGVISLTADGRIQRVNRALGRILAADQVEEARTLDDLFSREDAAEVRYLMKRARRTGLASRQLEMKEGERTLHLAVTISALEAKEPSGFVVVIEDTSELLRAQRAEAWHEVARRIAHEIKNPLTPIALSADRMARQLERAETSPEFERVARECAETISREVESVKALVDAFTQFARFPSAQPEPGDLNSAVEEALAVFHGRLDGIELAWELTPDLPVVNIDREQIRRVVVNLVDNAAEAMHEMPVKRLFVGTQAITPETVELVVADTGCGVSMEDREKLFLPYFSTKGRGTGLGLAIVSHILSDHHATIRVEDNLPVGARFIIEFPALAGWEAEVKPAGSRA